MDEFELFSLVEPEAKKHNLPVDLLMRQIKWESDGGKVRAVSPKGAQGLMQLMPATAASLGVTDPFDPQQNVRAGTQYMASLWKKHKGDQRKVLAEYNGGAAAVDALARGTPWKETSQYLSEILPSDQAPQPTVAPGQTPAPPVDAFEAFTQTLPPETFDATVAQAAQGATRMTPGYPGWVDTLRALPAAAGSMLSIASRAGGFPGAVGGAILGGLGAAGGEALTMQAENAAYQTGLSGVPPPSPEAALERLKAAGLTGAGGELLGRGAGAVISKGMAPFATTVDATGLEVRRMFPDALPNQVANSGLLDAATGVAEAGILGGGKIAQRKAAMAIQAQQEALGIVKQYGGFISEENAGKAFQEALEGNTEAFRAHAKTLYSAVDEASEGLKVDMGTLKEFAAGELEKRAGIPGEVSGNRGLKMLNQVAKAGESEAQDPAFAAQFASSAEQMGMSLNEFMASPISKRLRESAGVTADAPMAKEMTFAQAQTFRSDLTSFIRQATREKDDVARGTAQQLLKRLDAAMDTAGEGSAAKDLYRAANTFYREGKQRYESDLMRALADEYPEEVVGKLIGPGKTTPIREARAAIGEEGWKKIQTRVADDLVTKASDETGQIIGSQLLGGLRKLSPATLKEVFPNDEARALWTLGRVLDRSQQKIGATAKIGIYLAQSGAILGAMTGKLPASALGIFLSPKILATILTSKTGAKWLTTGLEAPPGSRLAAQAMRKVAEQTGLNLTGAREPSAIPPPSGQPQRGGPPPAPPPSLRSFAGGPP